MHTCSHSRLRDRLYAPLHPVRLTGPFPSMLTAALVIDTLRSSPRWITCACDPALSFSISSFPTSMYVLSSIIISLFPIEHCFEDCLTSILLTRRGLRHWDAPQKPPSLPLRPTRPLETVCVLLLDLVAALAKSILVFILSLEETFVRAFFLLRQPSLRAFT